MPFSKTEASVLNVAKHMDRRKTIGILTDWIDDQYQLDLLHGVADLAKERDINLLCFEGGSINANNEFEVQRNKVYDLVSPLNVNGLIILSALIGNFTDHNAIIQFCKRYHPIPSVILGMEVHGIPSLSVANIGISDLLLHLIQVHQYQKYAFIKGPESNVDVIQRYDYFVKTLTENQIQVDQQLVVQGRFTFASGKEAIRILLDERKGTFEVVVACNDDMAAGALEELKARGIRVPEEVAVVGFDNLDLCKLSIPPLTTVGHSIYELGRRSAEVLLDVMANKTVDLYQTTPTKLVIRQSCGCSPSAANNYCKLSLTPTLSMIEDKEKIIADIVYETYNQFADIKRLNISLVLNKLIDAFGSELYEGTQGMFLKKWDEVLDFAFNINRDTSPLEILLSTLRNRLIPYLTDHAMLLKAEVLFQQAMMTISEKVLKIEMNEHNESIQINKSLGFLHEQLLTMLDQSKSMDILSNSLSTLGFNSCYLAMFEGENQENAKLVLAYDETGRKSTQDLPLFFSQKLLPDGINFPNRQATRLLVALNILKPQLGFAIFEMGPLNGRIYSELRRIISSTIQVTNLFNKIQEQSDILQMQRDDLGQNLTQLRKVMNGIVEAISLTVESRDPYTAGHQHRVAALAHAIAMEMNLSPEQVECIQMAGIVHDLGKIYIPSEILNKPGRLNDLEFEFIKKHPQVAYNILINIQFPWPIARIILQHHERIDGSGYPTGIKGNDILLEAKILTIADVVEAMISHRPYRAALELNEALKEIDENSGLLYDSEVVDHCIKLFREERFQF